MTSEHPNIARDLSEAMLAAADPKPTLAEIRDAISYEAWRQENTQKNLMIMGASGAPSRDALRHIAKLDAAVRFFDACTYQPLEVAKRLQKQARK